jgi:hypothetical protein
MYKSLNQFLAGILICLFLIINGGLAQADDFNIKYDTAFTIRDDDGGPDGLPDGLPDVIDDDPPAGFWGLITNSNIQIDEFFLEFDISTLEQIGSAKFYFFFSRSTPTLSPGRTINLKVALYEGDGTSDIAKFGIGDFFTSVLISNLQEDVINIDVTNVINDFINSGISHLGIRLFEPISNTTTTGRPAQLKFIIGYLNIIPAIELKDTMHPAGSVHAYPNLLWPPNKKNVMVNFEGYIIDEMSMDRDGIGVSQAYLFVNGKKIILRDETMDLLNPDGSFSIVGKLRAKKGAIYPIELYAADTVAEEDGGPNSGLVDSTFVRVPHDMGGKSKDIDSKGKKNAKNNKKK